MTKFVNVLLIVSIVALVLGVFSVFRMSGASMMSFDVFLKLAWSFQGFVMIGLLYKISENLQK